MSRLNLIRHANTAARGGTTGTPAQPQAPGTDVLQMARDLRDMVESVNPDEFSWQEAHYDRDSRQGRELLFLMANHEWVRATSEIADIMRSDAIETTIKIDVDLSQIAHEAFRARKGRIWLPVAVLPPQPDQRHFEPDLFATVTDAAGDPVPMLPTAELQHQISAAMAEIIAKMAVSHFPARANGQHGGIPENPGRVSRRPPTSPGPVLICARRRRLTPLHATDWNRRSIPVMSGCCSPRRSTGCCGMKRAASVTHRYPSRWCRQSA